MPPELIAFIKDFGYPAGLLALVVWWLKPLVSAYFESATRAMQAMEGHGEKLAVLDTKQDHLVELAARAARASEHAARNTDALMRALGEEVR